MNLQERIEELIAENADDFEVSKAIKESYKLYLNSLESLFEETQGKNFLIKHTKSIDSFLKIIYKYILRKYFEDYSPMQNALPISLLALGSYGREQLCVYSDIDLMIVYKDIKGYNTKMIIESLLNMVWDSGLKLGHRVHEVSDLLQASRDDHTIKTALIESRFIYGSKFIWIETQNQLTIIKKEDQQTFIDNKLKEYHDRHRQYPIEMRANIKQGAGGMRDLNTVYWIGAILHHVSRVRDLVPLYISESDYTKMMQQMEFIFRLRAALHLAAKKKQDTLILELIPDIAKMFKLSQRKVAEKTYKALVEIETLSDIFIMNLTQSFNTKAPTLSQPINDDLYIYQQQIYANTATANHDLLSILSTLLPYTPQIDNLDTSFIAYLRTSVFSAKGSQQHMSLSKTFFYHDHTYRLLIALYRAQLLTRFFPPLAKVKFLPQFDGYHRYPVDLHSMHCMRALQNITDEKVSEVYHSLDENEKAILRLATFLHDCGKGRKKDHSELGAIIIKNYALEIGFSEKFATYAHTLIRYHTRMSNIAAREDIYNEKVIYTFIAKIKEPVVLKMLYVLTFADIESVSEGMYSNFNANLLKELYCISMDAFSHDAMISEAGKRTRFEKRLCKEPEFTALKKSTQKKILAIPSNLLFFKFTPLAISRLAAWMESRQASHEFKINHYKMLTIEILTQDPLNLGYLLGKLSNINVATMDIFAVEKGLKYFKIEFLETVDDTEIPYLEIIINDAFDMQKKTRLLPMDIHKNEIDVDCDHSNTYARMFINCKDQKGLLANIISVFDDMDIDIASAKIQTIKNRARNLFLIEKNGKFCAFKDTIINKLID